MDGNGRVKRLLPRNGRRPTTEGMDVAVIGTGHVGLPTCVTLAALGHTVTGLDEDAQKIELLQTGSVPFFEPGLEQLLSEGISQGRLTFSVDAETALPGRDVVFMCVGTPAREDGSANLLAVETAARTVARFATGPVVVVEKSTVPAGTAHRVRRALARERPDIRFQVVSNPEFLREGQAIEDSLQPDRILVGADSLVAFEKMRQLYAPLLSEGSQLIETDIETAELSKHACNAFLAMKISFANALARICERAGADVTAVTRVMGADARIGHKFLAAGLGYGGYCFPKDLQAFHRLAAGLGYDFPLLEEVARINDEAVEAVVRKVEDSLWNLEDKRVALLGLAFKPGTNDTRFSPALSLARRLIQKNCHVVGYDPQVPDATSEVPGLEQADDLYAAAEGAECVVLCTEWPEFRAIDLLRLRNVMAYPIFVDGRNLLDPKEMRAAGFTYYSTGRPVIQDYQFEIASAEAEVEQIVPQGRAT
jgi:UDPglucose 6-dehydrogenase